jgi:hypothetical protein
MCGNSHLDLVVIRIVRRVVVACCAIGLAAACSSNEGMAYSMPAALAHETAGNPACPDHQHDTRSRAGSHPSDQVDRAPRRRTRTVIPRTIAPK